jgi:hypothetical protein
MVWRPGRKSRMRIQARISQPGPIYIWGGLPSTPRILGFPESQEGCPSQSFVLGQCSWLISRPGLSDYFSRNEARSTISVALESQVGVDTATNNYEMCKFPLFCGRRVSQQKSISTLRFRFLSSEKGRKAIGVHRVPILGMR